MPRAALPSEFSSAFRHSKQFGYFKAIEPFAKSAQKPALIGIAPARR
jgi:hypothetical protein